MRGGGKVDVESGPRVDARPAIAQPLLWHGSGADADVSALGVLVRVGL